MKKLITIFIILILSIQVIAKNKLMISAGEYGVFSSEKIIHKGFTLHVISEAFKIEGYEVEYKFLPWARAYLEMTRGNYDASAFWFESAEKSKESLYSDQLHKEQTVFFYRKKDKVSWNKLEDLSKYRIGATLGYTYTDEFWDLAHEGTLNVETTVSDFLNIRKLIYNRIDIFPCSMVIAQDILRNRFYPESAATVTYSEKIFIENSAYLLFPKVKKESQELIKIFNRGLQKLKDNGQYDLFYQNLLDGKYIKINN